MNFYSRIFIIFILIHFILAKFPDAVNNNGMVVTSNAYASNVGVKILKQGGKFFLSVPIGKQRVEFNAHRVFSIRYLLGLFKDKYTIDYFSFVDDKGDLHKNIEMNNEEIDKNFDCHFGCAIFEMTKL